MTDSRFQNISLPNGSREFFNSRVTDAEGSANKIAPPCFPHVSGEHIAIYPRVTRRKIQQKRMRSEGYLVRDVGVAGSNPATPTI